MTKRLALIGYPVSHTLSPAIHGAAIRELGLDLTYEAVETTPERLPAFMDELRGPDWLGCNVSVPHKEAVLPFMAELSGEARAIGAVNTILNGDGRMQGYNTDAAGFLHDVQEHFGPVQGKRVVVLGAGGAARAVCYELASKAERVWVLNRTSARAEALVLELAGTLQVGSPEHLRECQLIVNCTSAGLHAGDSPLPDELVPEGVQLYDLIYNPAETRLMKVVRQHGGNALNGLGMLVRQAAAAFHIWTGIEPPLSVMFDAIPSPSGRGQG